MDDEGAAISCDECAGSGECSTCGGAGKWEDHRTHELHPCAECDGSGECPECGGEGEIEVPDHLLHIHDGESIFAGDPSTE